jgi:hypothetical protein
MGSVAPSPNPVTVDSPVVAPSAALHEFRVRRIGHLPSQTGASLVAIVVKKERLAELASFSVAVQCPYPKASQGDAEGSDGTGRPSSFDSVIRAAWRSAVSKPSVNRS